MGGLLAEIAPHLERSRAAGGGDCLVLSPATGITSMSVRGHKPEVIKRRAGHTDYDTTEGYIREAENLDPATFGTPFPPLPRLLLRLPDEAASSPESSSRGKRKASAPRKQGVRRGGGAGNRTRVRKLRGHLLLRAYSAVYFVL